MTSPSVVLAVDAAIGSGEILTVRYGGGRQPGATRQIQPRARDEQFAEALCIATEIVKRYRLDKIEIMPPSSALTYDPLKPRQFEGHTLPDFVAAVRGDLEGLGWVVSAAESEVNVMRRFKNGKPMKTPDVTLRFSAFVFDLYAEADGTLREESRPSKRPWYAGSGKKKRFSTFTTLPPAASLFMQLCRELAPPKP